MSTDDDAYAALWDVAAREMIPDYPGYAALGCIGLDTWMTLEESIAIKRRQDALWRDGVRA